MENKFLAMFVAVTIMALTGCSIDIGKGSDIDFSGTAASGSSGGESSDDEAISDTGMKDTLLIAKGKKDTIGIAINDLRFTGEYDYDNSAYVFYPDDGSLTGHKIACLFSLESMGAEVFCYSNGHKCHLSYSIDEFNTTSKYDAYWNNFTTCGKNDAVGPFVVPSDMPACGAAPLPACVFGTDSEDDDSEDDDSDVDYDSDDDDGGDVNIYVNIGDGNQNGEGNVNNDSNNDHSGLEVVE